MLPLVDFGLPGIPDDLHICTLHIQPSCQVDSSNRVYVKKVGGSSFLPWLRVSSLLIRMLGGGGTLSNTASVSANESDPWGQ